jgi:CarD family transcriptional regulator
MGYARGDTVVHPHHGTAVVTGVTTKDVGSGPTDYLELLIEHLGLTIMVPASTVVQAGIRDVSTEEEAQDILRLLDGDADVLDRWSERQALTATRMRSTELADLALIVRDLAHHSQRTGKPLSSTEKASRDAAVSRLVRELSVSLDLSHEEIEALIEERCAASAPEAP